MVHKLVLEVPEAVYEPLASTAKRTGATPETLAVEWLAAVSQQVTDDPVEKFIGAIRTDVSDWTNNHDKYLGQALKEVTRGGNDAGS